MGLDKRVELANTVAFSPLNDQSTAHVIEPESAWEWWALAKSFLELAGPKWFEKFYRTNGPKIFQT